MLRPRIAIAVVVLAALILPAAGQAAEGSLDPSFGTGGLVTTPIGPGAIANAVTIDSQGRIVAAGWSGSYPNFQFAVARYLPGGALDPSFNGTGIVTTPIGTFAQINAVAVDSQNRVVAAGYDGQNFVVARYTAQGVLDNGFGTGGLATMPIGTGAHANALAVAIDPHGGIVAGGYAYNGSDDDFALARFTDAGQPDMSFGSGGSTMTPIGSANDELDALKIDSQGRIVAAGYAYDGTNIGIALARYSPTGNPDPTFGGVGYVGPLVATIDDSATDLALDAQGRLVTSAHSNVFPNEDFGAWRFTSSGAPDPSFNGSGWVGTPIGSGNDDATSVAIDAEGRILVAGSIGTGTDDDFALVRYTPAGALDPSFGSGGKVTTGFGTGAIDDAYAMAIDAQQRIVVAGVSGAKFALARYIDDARGPTVTITAGPRAGGFTRFARPTFKFTVDDPTASAGCRFDLAVALGCASPFKPLAKLRNGRHTFTVSATDPAGNVGSAQRTFIVDTKRPKLSIKGHTKIRTKHRRVRARFSLKTNEKTTLSCKIDRRKAKRCRSRYRTPKLKPGKHRLQVLATDRAHNRTRKIKRFRIIHE